MAVTRYEVRDGVAVIGMCHEPVNSLSLQLRTELAEWLQQARSDTDVKAIVLIGDERQFSAGADITEFGKPTAVGSPKLASVIRLAEESPKPVVAALGRISAGGGLELAMSCHFRVAMRDAMVSLPEVKLGILPGAGGTQRLPRLIGVEAALDMIVSGEFRPVREFAETGFIDKLVDANLLDEAVAFALQAVAEQWPLRRVRDMRIDAMPSNFFASRRAAVAAQYPGLPAPPKCVDAVRMAVERPIDEGLEWEYQTCLELMQTPESKGLCHAFFSERAAAKVPDLDDGIASRPVKEIGVIGAGTMGGGIAVAFLNAGFPVTLVDATAEALAKGVERIEQNYASAVRRGRLSADTVAQRRALLSPTLDMKALASADLIIEAVFEEMSIKEGIFKAIDGIAKPGAILATNTSTLDVDHIAAFTSRPQDVIGTHFFSPANVMRLLEVVRGRLTAKDVLLTTMTLGKRIGKVSVVSGVCDGFIGNRMIDQYTRQAYFMLDEGALPEQIDAALERWGMAMGPLRMADLAGNEVAAYVRQRHYIETPHVPYSKLPDKVCALGRYGQKTNAGWYRYAPGQREALPDPEVHALIESHSREIGLQRRDIGDEEILERTVLALVNEGAKLLEEGIAIRAADVDVVYVTGYGFPRHRGGPMFWADQQGLGHVIERMAVYAANPHADPQVWEPAPLLRRLADQSKTFN